jgi:hypothetical protein
MIFLLSRMMLSIKSSLSFWALDWNGSVCVS